VAIGRRGPGWIGKDGEMATWRTTASTAAIALLGAAGWTVTEYGLHRFAMHDMGGKGLASKEHLKHHADVTYFAPTSKKLLSAAATTSVVLPTTWATLGKRRAIAFTGGLISMYFIYELIHRRSHTHPPTNEYGRWVRRNHLNHHFGGPRRNHGVTTPVWDKLFGTYDDPGVVTVPRRMAPVWMLDGDDVRPEYAHDYQARGRKVSTPDQAERDHADAFANLAPTAEVTEPATR
jgi:hypothetical protein